MLGHKVAPCPYNYFFINDLIYSISSSQPVAQTIYEFNAVDSVYKKTTDTVPSYEEVLGSSIEEFEENVTYYERSGSSPNYVYPFH